MRGAFQIAARQEHCLDLFNYNVAAPAREPRPWNCGLAPADSDFVASVAEDLYTAALTTFMVARV
jgi:hypothetical protein